MGVHDAPQWLISAFIRSCVAAGATASRAELEAACDRLLQHWGEPGRFHHNVKHLVDVLAKVDQLAEETHDPDLVRLAGWYHGAVFSSTPSNAYAQRGGEDEVASAQLAREELTALGVPEPTVNRVAEIITGIARHRGGGDLDIQALCDAELATLAVEPQRYAAYRRDVRAEYAHIPIRDYLTSRIAILTKLLGRKRLFASPLGQPWEDPARQNLTAELQRLHDELETLPAEEAASAERAPGEAPQREGDGRTDEADLRPGAATDTRTTSSAPARTDGDSVSTLTGLDRVPTTATLGRSTAEVVAGAQRESAPIIKRHEKKKSEREAKQELPGRS
jgi:predicted metal-dependent HD superfamily phosphohydrolase